MSNRRIITSKFGKITVVVAAIAAGTAIPIYATGGFDSPPPACYMTAPTSGATVAGSSVSLNAVCGASTADVQFLLDGSFIISDDGSSPFGTTWNSQTVADGAHTLTLFACDANSQCVTSGVIPVTTSNPGGAPVNTVPPNVSGTLLVGSNVACSSGTWTGDTSSGFAYQWKDGAGNISGATSSSYTVGAGENGLFLHCTVTATGTGGSASADSSVVGPVITGGSFTTAHVWVSAAGNDATCVRNASAVSYATALAASPTNVCATGPKGYAKASLGDNVLAEGTPFTVTAQWNFPKAIQKTVTNGKCDYNYGGTSDFSQCITFEPAAGQSLTFNCTTGSCRGTNSPTNGHNSPGNQVLVCVSGLSIQNATFTETTMADGNGVTVSQNALTVGSGDNACATSSGQIPHDDYFANNTYGAQVLLTGSSFNTYVVGGTALSTTDFPWQFGGLGDNGTLPAMTGDGIIGVTFDGFSFGNTSPGLYHMECIHANGAITNSFVEGNRLTQCPVESLFFETLNAASVVTGNTIEDNYFDAGAGGGPFKMDCAGNGCVVSDNIVRFNSFSGSWNIQCAPGNSSGTCNINNNTFYGNLGIGCVAIGYVNASSSNIVGTGWVDSGYNVVNVAKANTCTAATSSYSATITYTSNGPPNYNLDLNGAQTATNFVPNSVTWPLTNANIYGAARSGANTNAGAD